MKRVLEPELMDDPEQARAYAQADFEEENQGFVDRFVESYPDISAGHLLDLGCGPADIAVRLARRWPHCRITAVDASLPMIQLAEQTIAAAGMPERVRVRHERLQSLTLPELPDGILSNSVLHHLPNPLQFWYALRGLGKPGAPVLVMDLLRPESTEEAQAIVERYAAQEAPILKRDFFNSLLAAFTEDEVAAQLAEMNLSRLFIDVIDDRHWVVMGRLPGSA